MPVQQRLKDAVHQTKVILAGELVLHVNEVFGHRVEPPGNQFADVEANAG